MSRRRTTALAAATLLPTAITGPAVAHPGSHHGMSFAELAQHFASGWHLVIFGIALTAIGVLVFAVAGPRRNAKMASDGQRQRNSR